MTDTILVSPATAAPLSPSASAPQTDDIVREALIESRQRWRHLVNLATDLAFETDAKGRIVFAVPDTALGWPAGSLIGQPSELLVGDDGTGNLLNPFRPTTEVRRRRVWLRCFDGAPQLMIISATPLFDREGTIVGARGTGIDMTDTDAQTSQIAGQLRRGEVLDRILSRVGQETGADNMLDAALWGMIQALGAEGAAVIGGAAEDSAIEVLHECGPGASAILMAAVRQMADRGAQPGHTTNPDGRLVVTIGCPTRFGAHVGVSIWRHPSARAWDTDDTMLVGSTVSIVRMILEYEAIQRELAQQARTDPLTGLLNRRAFLEEMQRSIARLDRESEAGTLLFIDLDAFKTINDRLGHAAGDRVLVHLANMLRKIVRPSDLVARLGGDEFAVWLSGADHMTAAERADVLCKSARREIQALLSEDWPNPGEAALPDLGLGVSVGIATRRAEGRENIEDLTRRADMAMYQVKRSGRNHWRVALQEGER